MDEDLSDDYDYFINKDGEEQDKDEDEQKE